MDSIFGKVNFKARLAQGETKHVSHGPGIVDGQNSESHAVAPVFTPKASESPVITKSSVRLVEGE